MGQPRPLRRSGRSRAVVALAISGGLLAVLLVAGPQRGRPAGAIYTPNPGTLSASSSLGTWTDGVQFDITLTYGAGDADLSPDWGSALGFRWATGPIARPPGQFETISPPPYTTSLGSPCRKVDAGGPDATCTIHVTMTQGPTDGYDHLSIMPAITLCRSFSPGECSIASAGGDILLVRSNEIAVTGPTTPTTTTTSPVVTTTTAPPTSTTTTATTTTLPTTTTTAPTTTTLATTTTVPTTTTAPPTSTTTTAPSTTSTTTTTTTAPATTTTEPATTTTEAATTTTEAATTTTEPTSITSTTVPPPPTSLPPVIIPTEPPLVVLAHAAEVESLYHALLGRDPSASDLVYWSTAIGAGRSDADVAARIIRSGEFRRSIVVATYQALLGRPPTAEELTVGLTMVRHGSVNPLRAALLGSAEFSAHATSDDAFAAALYRTALGRSIDPAARSSVLAELAAGTSRGSVATWIEHSAEAGRRNAAYWYERVLGRTPSEEEAANWAGALRTGTSELGLVAGLAVG